jgi:hypothetical protein
MKNKRMANFGEYVRRNLTAHGKTITWLADAIRGNPTMVIKWRAGVEPRTRNFIKTCIKIAELRGDPVSRVIYEAAAQMGVPYEYTNDNPQCTCHQKQGNQ